MVQNDDGIFRAFWDALPAMDNDDDGGGKQEDNGEQS